MAPPRGRGGKRVIKKGSAKKPTNNGGPPKRKRVDEEIPSDEEFEVEMNKETVIPAYEDPEVKKIRQAKEYLDKISKLEERKDKVESRNDDPIAARLKKEALQAQKKIPKNLAAKLSRMQITTTNYNGHKLPPTCITMSGSSTCYTGSKDKCLISWDIETGKKNRIIKQAHSDHILSVAVSSDDKYLASSGRDKMIRIWDVRSPQSTHIFQLSGHFKDVTGVAFQSGTYQLYSSSLDRTVRVWDASQGSFVDTLYGHEGEVSCVDCMYNPRCLTAANDNSLRLWKVFEESQLSTLIVPN
ncbi:U3 small nucleolar RNA-interacting protein [Acrasis kona]|uniref:U3 small nucleolar RNA-interacting protein n=1 Tax=Acrasis kona TaxID=1008807 RepID=A0AAW2YKV6_9EUKA